MIMLIFTYTYAQTAPTKDPKEEPPKPVKTDSSDTVLEELQGGNDDMFLIGFHVSAKGKTDAENAIKKVKEKHTKARSATIDMTQVDKYRKLMRVLKLEGEPKRGHKEPLILVMKKGEGFIIRGPKLDKGIMDRIDKVEKGTIFGQSGNTPDTPTYSFGG